MSGFIFLSLIFSQSALCDCSSHPEGAPRQLCETLNKIERSKNGCHSGDSVCKALTEIRNGGDCFDLAKTDLNSYALCTGIIFGINTAVEKEEDACDDMDDDFAKGKLFRDAKALEAACKLGQYLFHTRPLFLKGRAESIVAKKISSAFPKQTPKASSTEPCPPLSGQPMSVPTLQALCSATGSCSEESPAPKSLTAEQNLTIKLLAAYSKMKEPPKIPYQDLTHYLKSIHGFIETHKNAIVQKAKQEKKSVYLRSDQSLDGSKKGPKPPCDLEVLPDGKIIVHLREVPTQDGNKVEIPPIGRGGYKLVYLGYTHPSYDLWASGQPIQSTKDRVHEMRFESRLQSSFFRDGNNPNGIAPSSPGTDYVTENGKKSHITGQPYYPMDMEKFLSFHHKQPDIEGHGSREVSLRLVRDLLEGLIEIHKKQVVHRDIQSRNIFIEFDDKGLPRARIFDLGLARDNLKKEGSTNVVGTPEIMSPEYIEETHKRPGENNPKTTFENSGLDVWSLGLIVQTFAKDFPNFKGEGEDFQELRRSISSVKNYSDFKRNSQIQLDTPPAKGTLDYLAYRMLDPDYKTRATAAESLRILDEIEKQKETPHKNDAIDFDSLKSAALPATSAEFEKSLKGAKEWFKEFIDSENRKYPF